MNKRKTILIGLLLCVHVAALAQTGKKASPKPVPPKTTVPTQPAPESAAPSAKDNQVKPSPEAATQKTRMSDEEYRQVGKGHEMLLTETGKWSEQMTIFIKPDERHAVYDMVSTREMILGNRFLKLERIGSIKGLEYSALGYIGYNNASEKYTAVWMDDMGTGTLVLEGVYHEIKKIITFSGEYMDHNTMTKVKITDEFVFTDDNTRIYRRYSTFENRPSLKTMEIRMTRL